MKKQSLSILLLLACVCRMYSAEISIIPTGTGDDTDLIQDALNGLGIGDTLLLNGDFIHKRTIYLGSDFTWILSGTLTLAKNSADDLDDYGLRYEGFDNSRATAIATREGAKNINMSGGIIYGNGDFNGRPSGLPRVRQVNMVYAENCYFHDFTVEDASDDCFTLGAASHHNKVERVIGRHAGGEFEKDGGNALTDVGHHNTWIDCVADQGGSDGWTPKCMFSTFIRCIASNNDGPGFGMYAREEGYSNNRDVGAHIIGNKFIDCVAYGSKGSSGFSLNISSNCPGAVIKDNFIKALCYDNHESGVVFRNKDDAEEGIIKDNVVDLVCYGNLGLTGSGKNNSWAGGLGMENDNSTSHNLIENITGSVICYDNSIDVNTRGGTNCKIIAYHPEGENNPILDDKSSGTNLVAVSDFSCSDSLEFWCQYKYCGSPTPPLPIAPDDLTSDVVSSSQIDLSWTDLAEGEDGYIIEQETLGYNSIIATVGANVTSFSASDLSELTEYTYRIQAYNISGFSVYSNETTSTTKASNKEIEPTGTSDDSNLMQSTLDGLTAGDTITLNGDFVIKHTIYLPSDFTWILNGSVTLAGDADLDEAGYADSIIDATRRTGITEKPGGAANINMSGGTYFGNSANYSRSMRYLNFGTVTNSAFHDMLITEVTDDNFTLGPGCNNNECRNLIGSYSKSGNAMTDKGEFNTWIDCIASDCGSDGWTPKCRYSNFIRCVAANNVGPGFGMYAREEGYADNKDVGAHIIGNKFFDCVSYGSLNSSGFSFNISSNCPGAIIRDNFIQALCYDNQGSGVYFRNKDDAELGIIEDNEVDILCYGNKGLNKSGNNSSWAGGLGMENDNSDLQNIIKNISGSVVCYDNRIDVNTRGGHNCNIMVYHPEKQNDPVLDDKTTGNNVLSVIDFSCLDSLETWCQEKYCALLPPLPNTPNHLTAEVISSSQINLSWTDHAEDEDGYIIEQKTTDSYALIDTVAADLTSFSNTDLIELTEYTYRVRAINITGSSDYSNEASAITGANSTSVYHSKSSRDLVINNYPNPFHSSTQIEYTIPASALVSLKVYDLSGREIRTLVHEKMPEGNHVILFDGSHLSGGTYFYILHAGDSVESGKFILL